jgi:hypothetical protein
VRELEQLIGLHDGVFYIDVRRCIYRQTVHGAQTSDHEATVGLGDCSVCGSVIHAPERLPSKSDDGTGSGTVV